MSSKDNKKTGKKMTFVPLQVRPLKRACDEIQDVSDSDGPKEGPQTPLKPSSQQMGIQSPCETNDAKDAQDVTTPVAVSKRSQDMLQNFLKKTSPTHQAATRFRNILHDDVDMFHCPPRCKPSFNSFQAMHESGASLMPVRFDGRIEYENESKYQLVDALVKSGVDFKQASEARRMLLGNFETLMQLRPKDAITKDGFQTVQGNAERRKMIEAALSKLEKLPKTEQNGYSMGVASVYIPGRVFYGFSPDPVLNELSYTNPLAVETEIDYDAETNGFDEGSERGFSSSGSSEDNSSDDMDEVEDGIGGANISEQQIQQMMATKELDDLEQKECDEAGMLLSSGIKCQQMIFNFLARKQKELFFPVPAFCPDGLAGQQAVFRVFNREVRKQHNSDEPEIVGETTFDITKDEVVRLQDGTSVAYNARIPDYLRPIMWRPRLDKLQEEFEFKLIDEEPEAELK